jgi:hypothetical protein
MPSRHPLSRAVLRAAAFSVLALVPLSAQLSGGAMTAGGGGIGIRRAPPAPPRNFTRQVMQDLNPAKTLRDRRKELALDVATLSRLDTLRIAYDARVATNLKRADSLKSAMVVPRAQQQQASSSSDRFADYDARVARAQAARRDYLDLLLVVKDDLDSTAARAVALLPAEKHRDAQGWVSRTIVEGTGVIARARAASQGRR